MKKQHPLLTEIQLGRSVQDVAQSLCDEMGFELVGQNDLENCIKELIRLNDPKARFVVWRHDQSCCVSVVNNKKWSDEFDIDYWDNEDNFALEDQAYADCECLNEVVEKLFGIKRPKKKRQITKEQYVKCKGKICPFCAKKSTPYVIDDATWNLKEGVACSKCGETWFNEIKRVLVGFS